MFGIYGLEEQKKLARRKAEGYRSITKIMPEVKKIISEFDGKVYNCRFDKALSEKLSEYCIYSRKRLHFIEIELQAPDLGEWRCIAQQDTKGETRPRINADDLIESMNEKRADFLKRAYDLEQAIENAEDIKAKIELITKTLEGLTNSLSYEAKDIFNLNAYVSRH